MIAVLRVWFAPLLLVLLVACAAPAASVPTPTPPPPQGMPMPYPLEVPPGYRISLYAEGLEELRSVTFHPDGTPFVTVMNRAIRGGGKVYALPDADGDGIADRLVEAAGGLDRPHGILFHEGQTYVSDAANVYRLNDLNGDYTTESADVVVSGMPTTADHWSRPFLFDADGNLLVIIGSSCNACQEGDGRRATLIRFDLANGATTYEQSTIVATGLRSVVDLVYRPGTAEIYATNNARDFLGPDTPPDQLFRIEEGKHYGWPYCYGNLTVDQEVLANPDIVTPDGSPKDAFCATQVEPPALLLPAHAAPLGLTFYDGAQFPAAMQGRLFIAYHGAFDRSNDYGYRVVSIPYNEGRFGTPEDFVSGFIFPDLSDWHGRPVDVAVAPDGSLFITDDVNGYLFRVEYIGT
jgi:glucose/arabinose dehydrogenase